jgi:predicted nucleic acid-binding protein
VIRGYLLDTNHVGAFARRDRALVAHLRILPSESTIHVSVISLGETEAGHWMSDTTNWEARDDYLRVIRNELRPNRLDITADTAGFYGELIGNIWIDHPPATPSVKTEAHLASLGVDVNDVWIAAQSIQHNLRLVTADKMPCIRKAARKMLDDCERWV